MRRWGRLLVGLRKSYNSLTQEEQAVVDANRSFTTEHADDRLLMRIGIANPAMRRLLQAKHAETIMTGKTWCMGLGTQGDETIHQVRVNDGFAYYPVWAEPLGPIVTYLTEYMAHRTTGWRFLL